MGELWTFIGDPANRDALSWLGGGLAVVCGGLWTVATFLWKPKPSGDGSSPAPSPAGLATAKRGNGPP